MVEKVLKGHTLNGKNFKVHLDGMNLLPFLKGDAKESPRQEFLYWSDDGDLMAIRVSRLEGRLHGADTLRLIPKTPVGVWQGNFTEAARPQAV